MTSWRGGRYDNFTLAFFLLSRIELKIRNRKEVSPIDRSMLCSRGWALRYNWEKGLITVEEGWN